MKSTSVKKEPILRILKECFIKIVHIVFLEIYKSFELRLKDLLAKKRLCFRKPSEELEKE